MSKNKPTYKEMEKRVRELEREAEKRKQAEEALRESEAKPGVILENVRDTIFQLTPSGIIQYVSPNIEELYGYKPEDLIGKHLKKTTPSSEIPKALKVLKTVLSGKAIKNFEINQKDSRGNIFTMEINGVPLEKDGKIIAAQGVMRDITERKRAEEALRKSEERYRAVTESAFTGISTADEKENLTYNNSVFARMLGYSQKELMGMNLSKLVTPADLTKIKKMTQLRKKGETNSYELVLYRKDGTPVNVFVSGAPLTTAEGRFEETLAVIIDITELKNAENALHLLVEMERLIIYISTDFTNIASDELDAGIKRALQSMGEFVGVDRSFVFLISEDGKYLNNTHEWCAEGTEPKIDKLKDLPIENFSWWLERLHRFENINITSLKDLPPEAGSEKKILQKQKMKSFLVVPMISGRSLVGFLGFASVKSPKTWPDEDIELLITVGDIFVNTLERKKVEESLRHSESRYRLLAENVTDIIWTMDMDLRFTYVSPSAERVLGYRVEDAISQKVDNILHPKSQKLIRDALKEELTRENISLTDPLRSRTFEVELYCKDRSTLWCETKVTFLRDKGGQPVGILGVTREITKRKQAEEALRNSEEKLRSLFENVPVGLYRTTPEGQIIMANPALIGFLGYSSLEELKKRNLKVEGFAPGYLRNEFKKRIEKDGEIIGWEDAWTKRDGSIVFIRESAKVVRNAAGKILYYEGTVEDITERKQTEENLKQAHAELDQIFNTTSPLCVIDKEYNVIRINRTLMDMFGLKEDNIIGKKCSEVFSGPRCHSPSCPLKRILNGEERVEFELEKELKDGSKPVIIMTSTPLRKHDGELIGIVERFTDITIHKQLEEERSKASKIESLGILAGGIAHDFNNFLGAVMNNIWMAKKYEKTEGELCNLMENTEEVVLRAKNLTQQLLTFSKGGALVKKTTSLSGLIKDACSFSLRGSNVKCRHSIPGDLRPAEVDEGQINQVISNLIINADQAMPDGGTINVRAENITVGSGDALPLDEGKYIKITIADQGIGIPGKHLPKIFDPYFSTKQKGSGLGLATSYSIIKKHGGHIFVESEVGVGTTFQIYLPASSAKIKEKMKVLKEVPSMRGNILVMDDEGFYRDSLRKLLESFGHKVEVAADGTETIKLYKKAKKVVRPFNLVILDLTIRGGMGGKEVIERLLKIDPDVKAIVSSGYSNDPVLSDFRRYGFSGMVSKPFKIEELKGLLHSILAPEKA